MQNRKNAQEAASIVNRLPSYQQYELETEMRIRIISEIWNNTCTTVSQVSVSTHHSEIDQMVQSMREKYQPRILLESFPFRHKLKKLGFELMPDLPGDRPAEGIEDIEDVLVGEKKAKHMRKKMDKDDYDIFDEYKRLAKSGKLLKAIDQGYFDNYPYYKTGKIVKNKLESKPTVQKNNSPIVDKDIDDIVKLFAPVTVVNEESNILSKDQDDELIAKYKPNNVIEGKVGQYQGREDLVDKTDKWLAVSEAALESIHELYDIQGRHFMKLLRDEATARSLGYDRMMDWYRNHCPTTMKELVSSIILIISSSL